MPTATQTPENAYRGYAFIGFFVALALLFIPLLAAVGFVLQFAFVIVGPALLIAAIVHAFATPAEAG